MDNFQQEFKASSYCPHCQAKKLLAEKGMLSSTNIRPGKVFPPTTAEVMKQFFFCI
jgi:hypothetical protein